MAHFLKNLKNPDLGPFTYGTEHYLTISLPYTERIR